MMLRTARSMGLGGMLGLVVLLGLATAQAQSGIPSMPPLTVSVLDDAKRKVGTARVWYNYVELADLQGAGRGALGVLWSEGSYKLFLIGSGGKRDLVGWAENHALYNQEDKLLGYYFWTPIWSYVYDPDMKKVGEAQCLAHQGVCAAGVAGFLLKLF